MMTTQATRAVSYTHLVVFQTYNLGNTSCHWNCRYARGTDQRVDLVTARLSDTAQNAMCNIVTIFLATGTGLTMTGDKFLRIQTIEIIVLGLIAFAAGTAGGVLFGQVMRIATHNKINPLIGSAEMCIRDSVCILLFSSY